MLWDTRWKIYRRFQIEKGDWRQSVNLFEENTYKSNFKKVEKLKDIAKEKELELSHVALAWLLNQKELILLFLGNERNK